MQPYWFPDGTDLLESYVAHAVKISEREMEVLREAAAINSRSISGQAEHWLRIGRASSAIRDSAMCSIEQALKGLRPVEQPEAMSSRRVLRVLRRRNAACRLDRERAFWEDRQRKGLGVGMDEEGNIVQPEPLMGRFEAQQCSCLPGPMVPANRRSTKRVIKPRMLMRRSSMRTSSSATNSKTPQWRPHTKPLRSPNPAGGLLGGEVRLCFRIDFLAPLEARAD